MARRYRVPSARQIEVLRVFMAQQARDTHGYDIMKATGIGPGTLYGLLKRLSDDGYLSKNAEIVAGRCRIGYRLTESGKHYAERALIENEYEEGIKQEAAHG